MLRSFLLATAAVAAIPALAQTGGSGSTTTHTGSHAGHGSQGATAGTQTGQGATTGTASDAQTPVSTATNDHDPTEDASNSTGVTNTGNMSQVNGGVTTSSTGQPGTGTTATAGTSMGTDQGTSNAGTSGTMSGQPSGGMTGGTMQGQATAGGASSGSGTALTGPSMTWNWTGDMGQIGTSDWGVRPGAMGQSAMAGSGMPMGVGGPIDVAGQWAQYAGEDGMLTPLEFGMWMMEAHGQNVGQQVKSTVRGRSANLPAVQVLNVTAGALAQADTNGDWRISREELSSFSGQS